MQQQSMQYHIDAIRNILSLPTGINKNKTPHGICLDPYKSIIDIITRKTDSTSGIPIKYYFIGALAVYIIIVNMIISYFADKNPIIISNIPACLYLLWMAYGYIHANSPEQKKELEISFMYPEAPLLFTTIIEMYKTPHITIQQPSSICIPIMFITTCISTLIIAQSFIREYFQKDQKNIRFPNNTMFIQYENTFTPPRDRGPEHIQQIIHPIGDIIILGYNSRMHEILTERYEKFPHNRTILEQHFYHLSCQVPLIYITPSNNYIRKTT